MPSNVLRRLLVLAVFCGQPLLSAPLYGATDNPDWPCVQRFVPSLSPAMMWGGPPIGADLPHWRDDPSIAGLVERLADRRLDVDEAKGMIEKFADGLTAEQKPTAFTMVFIGLLNDANQQRGEILDGITRYTRKQRVLADDIRKKRQQLNEVLAIDEPSAEDIQLRDKLENELNWQTRIHDERERSLTVVCEIPVLLEQRIFDLGRELAAQTN